MDARKVLLDIYRPIQRIIAPTLRYSQYLYEDVLKSYVKQEISWLDIGCGHQLLPSWRYEEEKNLIDTCHHVIGIDYDLDSLKNHNSISIKVRGNITQLPFSDNRFNFITANMVVEYLDDPETQFKEISRILKPEGYFIFHTPNAISIWIIVARLIPSKIKLKLIKLLQGREEDDIFKTYYRINSKGRIAYVASKSDLMIEKIKMIVTAPTFAIIPPLAIFELIIIRIFMLKPFERFRSNIIAVLKKANPQEGEF